MVSSTLAGREDLPVEVVGHDPTVLGSGISLFEGPATGARFEPVDQVELPGGVRVVTLDRAG